MRIFFGMETLLRGCSGGHTGTAPTVSFGRITRGMVGIVWGIARGRLVSFGWIARGMGDFVWGGLRAGGFVCLLGKRCT